MEFVIENERKFGGKNLKSASDKLPPTPEMFTGANANNSLNGAIEMGMNTSAPVIKPTRRPSANRPSTARNNLTNRRAVPNSVEEIEITGARKRAKRAAGPSRVRTVKACR